MKTDPKNWPKLTDDLRPGLRRMPVWTVCFRSWCDSVRPSEARAWLAGGRESFLRHLDSLAWKLGLLISETEQTADDWAEATREILPAWEDSAETTAEETDREDATPLSEEETERLETLADAATGEAAIPAS